jgi:polyhydroxyalkanoate synthase
MLFCFHSTFIIEHRSFSRERDDFVSTLWSLVAFSSQFLLFVLILLGIFYVVAQFGHIFYGTPSDPDRVEYAVAADGWKLGFEVHEPEGSRKGVVITCHGLAVNHYNFDLGHRASLVKTLVKEGWEVWNASLRGCGHSRVSPDARWNAQWNMDDHVRLDVPAMLSFVTERTGEAQLHWVGHSMGGLVMYGHLGLHPDESRLKSVCTMASPDRLHGDFFTLSSSGAVNLLTYLLPILPGRWFIRGLSPMFFRWPVNLLLCRPRNLELHMFRRAFFMLTENLSRGIVRQIFRMLRTGAFNSEDGQTDYRANLKNIRTPICFFAGSDDYIVPEHNVRNVYEAVQSEVKEMHLLGTASGDRQEYCHGAILFGKHSEEDVFPKVQNWLEKTRTWGK